MKLVVLSIMISVMALPAMAHTKKTHCEQVEFNTLDEYDKMDADLHYWRQVIKMSTPGTPTHVQAIHQARKLSKKIARYVASSKDECDDL